MNETTPLPADATVVNEYSTSFSRMIDGTQPAISADGVVPSGRSATISDSPEIVVVPSSSDAYAERLTPPLDTSIAERGSLTAPATALSPKVIRRQWQRVAGTVQHQMRSNPTLRKAVKGYIATPVTESLPASFTDIVSQSDPTVGATAALYTDELGAYLAVPPVPDELLVPDSRHAPNREAAERAVNLAVSNHGEYSPNHRSAVALRDRAISSDERDLVHERYVLARDVKLLALGAELQDEQASIDASTAGEITLPSGVRIVADKDRADISTLLDPNRWENRRQLVDRVHTFTVDGKKYVMKERKTARHTNTRKDGHEDGLTSQEEYEVAQDFNGKTITTPDNITVRWEKPVGAVTFPDGYQFSVFEFEELGRVEHVRWDLERAIREHPEQFAEEYAALADGIQNYRHDPRLQWYADDEQGEYNKKFSLKTVFSKNPVAHQIDGLSYEDYVKVKAFSLVREVPDVVDRAIADTGYYDPDDDGFVYFIKPGETVGLDVVAFDFERYERISDEKRGENLEKEPYTKTVDREHGLGFMMWMTGGEATKTQQAAYLEMLRLQEAA